MKNKYLRIGAIVIILTLIVLGYFNNQEIIEQKDIRIKTLETQVFKYSKIIKEHKNINTTRYFSPKEGGGIKSTTTVDNKKSTDEKGVITIYKKADIKDKTKTHTNPKNLFLGLGQELKVIPFEPKFDPYLKARYRLWSCVHVEGKIHKSGNFTGAVECGRSF